jgi:hypothetical protein
MSQGHIEFFEVINAPEKTYTVRFNPSTVHAEYNQSLNFTVKDFPGICKAEVYRDMNAVIWFEHHMPAIAAAEAAKSSNTTAEKISHLLEARKAKQTEKAATTVEVHSVFYNFKNQTLGYYTQELTITPVLRTYKGGPIVARQDLVGALNLNENGFMLAWLCRYPEGHTEDPSGRVLITELFTKEGQVYYASLTDYIPDSTLRFYSISNGKRMMMRATVLPDNTKEVIQMEYWSDMGAIRNSYSGPETLEL